MSGVIRLRPSGVLKYDECPRQYFFQYQERLRSDATSANLPFGTAVHEAMTGYVLAKVSGKPFDALDTFDTLWSKALETEVLEFSSMWDEDSLRETGKVLVERFQSVWDDSGFTPLIDGQGPVVERRFEVEVAPGVSLSGQPDVIAVTPNGDVVALDVKTTAQPYDPSFLLIAEQLTAYQILLDGHRDSLGIEKVNQVGFVEAIKRKVPKTNRGKGPEVHEPMLTGARSKSLVDEYLDKVQSTARGIATGDFPRRPRMAYNSPCQMCDFRGYCLQGSMEGLTRPDDSPRPEAE